MSDCVSGEILSGLPPFRAKWITAAGSEKKKNFHFRARKKFLLEEVPGKTLLRVAAESYYVLYVNSFKVGMGPARGTRTVNFFDIYDITGFLRKGENFVSVLSCCWNIPTFTSAPARPAIIVQADGIIESDSSWEVLETREWDENAPVFTLQTGFADFRDMRSEPEGWKEGKDGLKWEKALEIAGANSLAGKKLLPRDIPDLRETTLLCSNIPVIVSVPAFDNTADMDAAKLVSEEKHADISRSYSRKLSCLCREGENSVRIDPLPGKGGFAAVFDFKKEVIGSFALDISAPEGAIVDIAYEEQLVDSRLKVKIGDYSFADRYIMREGRQQIGTVLTDRGFRMVQVVVRNFDAPVTIHSVKAVDRRYPVPPGAEFYSSDSLLNRVWSVCAETMSTCTTDVFTDCPWRERAFWVNDMMIENITWLEAFGDARVNARAFRLAVSNVHGDKLVPGVCPDRNEDFFVLVPTNLFLALMLEDYLYYTGDRALVKEIMPFIRDILGVFRAWEDRDGLVTVPEKYWNFLDWSYEPNNFSLNGRNTAAVNWIYVLCLDAVARLESDAGNAEKCRRKATLTAKAIDRRFWDKKRKAYAEWIENNGFCELSTQLTHAFAVLSGRLPAKRKAAAARALLRKDILMPELYMHHFVFKALAETGERKEALRRIRKYWGPMVLDGSPTIWEANIHQTGKKAFGSAGSLCHGFATTPINFLQRQVLGVKPAGPGFSSVLIEPHPCGLKFAKGSVIIPMGNIEVEWVNKGGKARVSAKLPGYPRAVEFTGKKLFKLQ